MLLSTLPLVAYFHTFNSELSDNSSVWADFGSYIGGVYGALGFLAIVYTFYSNGKQSAKAEQDQVFYKLMELFANKVESFEVYSNGDAVKGQKAIEKLAGHIFSELERECIFNARELLCTRPGEVSDLHYQKLVSAMYGDALGYEHSVQMATDMKKSLVDAECYRDRWEKAKNYIDSKGHERESIQKALYALGSVWLYKISFEDRKIIYENAVRNVSFEYSDFIDSYIKTLEFLAAQINESINKEIYFKFIKSQLSRHEAQIIFSYAMSNSNKEVYKTIIELGLVETVKYEGRSFLIDAPSNDDIDQDFESIKAS